MIRLPAFLQRESEREDIRMQKAAGTRRGTRAGWRRRHTSHSLRPRSSESVGTEQVMPMSWGRSGTDAASITRRSCNITGATALLLPPAIEALWEPGASQNVQTRGTGSSLQVNHFGSASHELLPRALVLEGAEKHWFEALTTCGCCREGGYRYREGGGSKNKQRWWM